MKGFELPLIKTEIPGPESKLWLSRMHKVEPPNITYSDSEFPVLVKSAYMNNVWDVDGNRFVDLTSFFGVALLGHRHPVIEDTISKAAIYHGMGDVHPSPYKVQLLERINSLLGGDFMGIFAQSGSEAVETCLKTQLLYKKKPKVAVFEGAYHGLGMGALNLTQRDYFKEGLWPYLNIPVISLPFPVNAEETLNRIEDVLKTNSVGLVFLEPIQGRGGIRIFKDEFLNELQYLTQKYDVLLGFDEIFTGMFRTGYFSYARSRGIDFDLITLGKGLSSQFPLSVCMGKREIMEKAWPKGPGEAKHTYTFLGHPLFTMVSLKVIETVEKERLNEKVLEKGEEYILAMRKRLKNKKQVNDIRGTGFMLGIEFVENVFPLTKKLLGKGFLTLPGGEHGNVLEIIPPVCITDEIFYTFLEVLNELVQ